MSDIRDAIGGWLVSHFDSEREAVFAMLIIFLAFMCIMLWWDAKMHEDKYGACADAYNKLMKCGFYDAINTPSILNVSEDIFGGQLDYAKRQACGGYLTLAELKQHSPKCMEI